MGLAVPPLSHSPTPPPESSTPFSGPTPCLCLLPMGCAPLPMMLLGTQVWRRIQHARESTENDEEGTPPPYRTKRTYSAAPFSIICRLPCWGITSNIDKTAGLLLVGGTVPPSARTGRDSDTANGIDQVGRDRPCHILGASGARGSQACWGTTPWA